MTWPHKLERLLADDYGYSQIEVVNAGVPAYSTFESAVNFMLRAQDLDPDMIILYHATNDVRARLVDPAHYRGGYELRGTWRTLDQNLPASALQRLLMHKLGNSLQLAFSLDERMPPPPAAHGCQLDTSGAEAVCANLGMTAVQVLDANPPIYFERNLQNIISMAQSRDIATLLLTWAYSPYVYDAPNGDVMSQPFRQAAVAEHNAIIRELAAERALLFYDMAANLPSERQYWINGVHQSDAGTSEMARQLADYLAGSGALD
ncbi:MAG: SGNH/GDSL hydrolase family protein [Chloroflexi bacterium]|nr:SGNH/GDSL hydrolase family protein [Chloroflexota bacterium]